MVVAPLHPAYHLQEGNAKTLFTYQIGAVKDVAAVFSKAEIE